MNPFDEYGPMPPPAPPPRQPASKLSSLLAYNSQVQFKRSGSLLSQTNEVRVHIQGQTRGILKKQKPGQKPKKKIRFNEEVEQIEFEKIEDNSSNNVEIQEEYEEEEQEEELFNEPPRKTFDFKREYHKQQLSSSSLQFPESFGRRPLLPAASTTPSLSRKEQQIMTDYEQQYGKGAAMFLKQGGNLNKGLGKYEQGRLEPVEAVRKNQYMNKAEAKFQKLLEGGEGEKQKEKKEKKKVVEREKKWKIDNKKKEKENKKSKLINDKKPQFQAKRNIPTKTLDISYTDTELTTKNTIKSLQDYSSEQRQPITNQKVIDMTGTETRFFQNYQALKIIVNESSSSQQNDDASCKEYRLLGDMVVSITHERERIKKHQEKLEREVEENELDNLKYELEQSEQDCQLLKQKIQEVELLKNVIPKLKQWGEEKEGVQSLIELVKGVNFEEEIMEKILIKSLHDIQIEDVLIIGLALKEIFAKAEDSVQIIERIMQNVIDQIANSIKKEWNPISDIVMVKEIDKWINNIAVPVDMINSFLQSTIEIKLLESIKSCTLPQLLTSHQ